jgi:hypothetical protein
MEIAPLIVGVVGKDRKEKADDGMCCKRLTGAAFLCVLCALCASVLGLRFKV